MRTEYDAATVRPEIVCGLVEPAKLAQAPLFRLYWYEVTGAPPFEAGAENATVSVPSVEVMTEIVGGSGIVLGIAAKAADAAPAPPMFTARTRNWYSVPLSRPLTMNGEVVEAGERAVYEEPLSVEYS
jgi:hypothetical protein